MPHNALHGDNYGQHIVRHCLAHSPKHSLQIEFSYGILRLRIHHRHARVISNVMVIDSSTAPVDPPTCTAPHRTSYIVPYYLELYMSPAHERLAALSEGQLQEGGHLLRPHASTAAAGLAPLPPPLAPLTRPG